MPKHEFASFPQLSRIEDEPTQACLRLMWGQLQLAQKALREVHAEIAVLEKRLGELT